MREHSVACCLSSAIQHFVLDVAYVCCENKLDRAELTVKLNLTEIIVVGSVVAVKTDADARETVRVLLQVVAYCCW